MVGVGIPAPVDALVDVIERCDFGIGDFAQLKVAEHLAARARGDAQILMLIGSGIGLPQQFRVIKEHLTEPFRRHGQIGAGMYQPIRTLYERLLIHKVVQGDGRVERQKIPKPRATTVG